MFEFPFDLIMFINPALILLFVFVLYKGYKQGMIMQLVNLVNTFVSLVISYLFSDVFANVFQFVSYDKIGIASMDQFISFQVNRLIWIFVLFVVIRLVLIVLKPIAQIISKMPLIKQVNSVFGAVFSIVNYAIYILLIVLFLSTPIIKNGSDLIDFTYLRNMIDITEPVISNYEELISDNLSIQSLINGKNLSVTQKQKLVNLLVEEGFSNDEIKEFLNKYE